MVRMSGAVLAAVPAGIALGLGLWTLVALLPRLGAPRLGARIAPYLLDVSPEASADRIRMRSRDVEAKIELGYLQALYEGYQEFISSISKVIPVIRVDYARFATAEEMAEVIKREYLDASFLRQVTRFDPVR